MGKLLAHSQIETTAHDSIQGAAERIVGSIGADIL